MRPDSNTIMLLPVPRKATVTGDALVLPGTPTISFAGQRENAVHQAIAVELGPVRRAADALRADIQFRPVADAPADLRRWAQEAEGYALAIGPDGIRLWAATAAGHLYGAMTLRQIGRQFGCRLPGLRIGDAPSLRHRGVQLSFPQGHTAYRHAFMRHVVPELARWKINALYLYLESFFDFPSLPHTAGPGAMTADEARDLDRLCRAYNVALIPQLNVLAHAGEILSLQKYHHLLEYPPKQDLRTVSGFNLCATSPAVRRFVDAMLHDVFAAFSADIIHVGGDEVSMLGECPDCLKRKGKLDKMGMYQHYFGRIRDLSQRKGRRIGIWGDMLLHYGQKAAPLERRRLLAPLREGVVIYDWHYGGGSPETVKFFVANGFETIACSSSNLCYSASVWPSQAVNQRLLFADALAAGALGGMTTAWCNFTGLHEEHLNYLFATGATALWSAPSGQAQAPAPGLTLAGFERAYCLQRYGLRSDTLTQYWHVLGDAGGPVLKALAPCNGVNVRKCLYHTDNVLTFWIHYSTNLRGAGLEGYRAGIQQARRLWNRVRRESRECTDVYLPLQEGPLLMHEHLLKRFEMTEALYALYAAAARAQYAQPATYARLLRRAAAQLLWHLEDFPPIEAYLVAARKQLGLDRSSILRVQATQRKTRELAAFLEHLAVAKRPLPAFSRLHGMFLGVTRTDWYGDREHEWALGPARFQRYTLENGPWPPAPEAQREPGPHVPVQTFQLSRLMPPCQDIRQLAYPRDLKALRLKPRRFPDLFCHVHADMFPNGEDGVVYYLCRMRCPKPMKLEIGFGYDGPVKLWVDRQPRYADPAGTNPSYPDKGRISLAAGRGIYEILVALSSNQGKAYGILLTIRRADVTVEQYQKAPEQYALPTIEADA